MTHTVWPPWFCGVAESSWPPVCDTTREAADERAARRGVLELGLGRAARATHVLLPHTLLRQLRPEIRPDRSGGGRGSSGGGGRGSLDA